MARRTQRRSAKAGSGRKAASLSAEAKNNTGGQDTEIEPLVGLARRFIALHEEASRRSQLWRQKATELARRGLEPSPLYAVHGTHFSLWRGDLSEITAYFKSAIESTSDAPTRAKIARRRDYHLRNAAKKYAQWHAVARKLGVEEASERNDAAWDAVDKVDLPALWKMKPCSIAGAIALLRVVRCAGWTYGHPDDHAGPVRVIDHVCAFLQATAP
jgi:hypothetical protein